ncbi:RrF2 family transcriptional regulator [Mucilaginibacter sp. OK098]|uniref:RrF2 family transcriptional regulator n=1 Tax=Mucilaginibacter sp. OK098 TaxID=1855297 RepID=UPI0009111384|nr:Rrf2 family transcriptional regulator [Mucilaginibacter sp. OK098]SHM94124.1 transcriptional regulator, BadM/Rrf2 family [Mucilaginibacter sp. OK098]
MGIFSKTCEYAMRAVFFIAHKTERGRRAGVKEIAEGIGSPEPFLARILQDLSRKNIIKSAKGPTGGFYVDDDNLKLPLAVIVEAIDGSSIYTGCAMGLPFCSEEQPCPLHNRFKDIRSDIHALLQNTTIAEFNEDLNTTLLRR